MRNNITITKYDKERLEKMLKMDSMSGKYSENPIRLERELERAEIISPNEVQSDVITMHSIVYLKDLDTKEKMTLQLVYPNEANLDENKISILAPVGTAILGYRVGSIIYWIVPAGLRRLKIEEILYQPEATGDTC